MSLQIGERDGDTNDSGNSAIAQFFSLRSNLSRAVLIFVACLSTYVAYGRFHFYRDPVSIFFSEEHGYDRFYSAHREREAQAFGSRFSSELSAGPLANIPPRAGDAPLICASFVSVVRQSLDRQYLETALASLIANLTVHERELLHIKVFFADPNPALHPQYGSTTIQALADDTFAYQTDFPLEDLNYITKQAALSPSRAAIEKKSMFDYSRAMDRCLSTTSAPYIAVFEDDILFADGWFAATMRALDTARDMMAAPPRQPPVQYQIEPGRTNDWLYLRLFNQERSTGWGGGTGFLANNVPYISGAIGLPLLLLATCLRRVFRKTRLARALDAHVLAFSVLIALPTAIWLLFASGKASLFPPAPGVHEEFFGCCNQALVYKREHAAAMSPWMIREAEARDGGRGDMLSRQFAFERGLARLSAYPMVVQHVGAKSVSGTTAQEAQQIWSMAFEDFDAARLARTHDALARELFPGKELVYIT